VPTLPTPVKLVAWAVMALAASLMPASASCSALAESPARLLPRSPSSAVTSSATTRMVTIMMTIIATATLPRSSASPQRRGLRTGRVDIVAPIWRCAARACW
jgi:hypothetical protein